MSENASTNKKKSIWILVGGILSVLLIVVGIVAAVIGIRQATCKHTWDKGTIKTEATCSDVGEIVYKCESCNKKTSKEIEKISHTWKFVEGLAPTCTQNGYEAYTVCEVCEAYKEGFEFKEVLATGHTEIVLEGYAETCTELGLTEGKQCTTCGEITVEQKSTPALGHKIVTVEAVEPTCIPGMTTGQKCATCGRVYWGCEEVPATDEHSFIRLDSKRIKCTVCGEVVLLSKPEKQE